MEMMARRYNLRLSLLCVFGVLLSVNSAKKAEIFTLTSEPSLGDDDTLNFFEVVRGRPIVLVNFMIDCPPGTEGGMEDDQVLQCRACRDLKPIYKKLAKRKDLTTSVAFAEVDIEAEEKLASVFNVTTAPTLMLFLNRTIAGRYEGEAKLDALADWIQNGGAPLVHEAKSETDLSKILKARPKSTAMVVGRGTKQVRNMLVQTSAQIQVELGSVGLAYEFVLTNEEKFGLEVHRGVNEKVQFEAIPDMQLYAEDFVSYVKKELVPMFSLATPHTVNRLMSNASGVIWVCFAPESVAAQAEKYAVVFRKAAQKWKKFRFAYVDTAGEKLPEADPGCEEYPSVVFQKGGKRASQTFAPKELTEANVNRFIKNANAGKSGEL